VTQPRKEQIKNLKTKYSSLNTGGPPVAIVPITGQSRLDLTGTDYNNYLALSFTGVPNGARESVPATIIGSIQEPFGIPFGSTMNIIVPSVNNGLQVTITFLISDIVVIDGINKLTATKAANRINATLASYGLATPLASSAEGYLKIISPDVGPTATFTLKDGTPGILTAFGFGAAPSVTVNGFGQVRGILTRSVSDKGGVLPFRFDDGATVLTQVSEMKHYGDRIYKPNVTPGLEMYGRISWFPGPKLRIQSFAQGSSPFPFIVSNGANFSSITLGSVLNITLNDPQGNRSFSVTFGTIGNRQDVINAINDAWRDCLISIPSPSPCQALVTGTNPEPYNMVLGSDDFYIAIDSNTPIQIFLPASPLDKTNAANEVVTSLNNQLSGATASVYTDLNGFNYVQIQSNSTDGTVSKIQLLPGDGYNLGIGKNIRTLDKLGMSVGTFRGSVLASVYGGAEIMIQGMGTSSMVLSGDPGVMALLGLPATSIVAPSTGEITAPMPIGAADVTYLLPEVMEFGEVPQDIDEVEQEFIIPDPVRQAMAEDGIANQGQVPPIGPDGKIDSRFIKAFFDYLATNSITAGAKNETPLDPRIITPFNSSGYNGGFTLIWESVPTPYVGDTGGIRAYANSNGEMSFTMNAKWNGSTWNRDIAAGNASCVRHGPYRTLFLTKGPAGATWDENTWDDANVIINNGPDPIDGYIRIGLYRFNTVEQAIAPRLNIPYADAGGPIAAKTLIEQSPPASGAAGQIVWRRYNDGAGGSIETLNAKWDGTNWNKDVTGKAATATIKEYMGNDLHIVHLTKVSTDDAPWTDTTWTAFESEFAGTDGGYPDFTLNGTLWLGANNMWEQDPYFEDYGSPYNIPRLITIPDTFPSPGLPARTLLWRNEGTVVVPQWDMYTTSDGAIEYVTNAFWNGATNLWTRFNSSESSTKFVISDEGIFTWRVLFTEPSTWSDSGWVDHGEVNSAIVNSTSLTMKPITVTLTGAVANVNVDLGVGSWFIIDCRGYTGFDTNLTIAFSGTARQGGLYVMEILTDDSPPNALLESFITIDPVNYHRFSDNFTGPYSLSSAYYAGTIDVYTGYASINSTSSGRVVVKWDHTHYQM
jgi:hypothetical protein